MTLASITKANLYSQAWQNIYDTLNTRSYVTDPLSPGGGRKFLYTRLPNIKDPNFAGFPFIVIDRPQLDLEKPSLNYTRKTASYTIQVLVYSSDRLNTGTRPGDGMSYGNSITNDILEAFNGSTVKEALRPYGVQNLNVKVVGSDVDEFEEELAFVTTLELSFEDRKTVV